MKKVTQFDVLVVYTAMVAKSAAIASKKRETPFARDTKYEPLNTVYGYFLEVCRRKRLRAAFTTSADIVGAGKCRSFWRFNRNKWIKVRANGSSRLIFDKFSPVNRALTKSRKLLFSKKEIKPFNDPDLFSLFFDKQKTYAKLAEYSIPTVSISDNTAAGIRKACGRLGKLRRSCLGGSDFSSDVVMKDRFGAGGRQVYKFMAEQREEMLALALSNPKVAYIIQPFAKFDLGFNYLNRAAATDIRLIYLGGKIVQSYIRVAKLGEFRCNEHQGGQLSYLSLGEIPRIVVEKSDMIAELLNKKCSLFTLDFILSNNGNAYFLEGNTGPGLDWNMALKRNEIEAKKLIRLIVKELKNRTTLGGFKRLETGAPDLSHVFGQPTYLSPGL